MILFDQIMTERDLKNVEAAAIIRKAESAIKRYREGTEPQVNDALKLAEWLNIPVEGLFGEQPAAVEA
jgi:hypothetical protein